MNFRAGGTVLALVLAAVAWTATEPRIEAAAATGWVLVHVDVETTGLVPGHHEMVDVGIVYTEMDGTELGRFYRKIMPQHLDRVQPGAVAVNGFDAEIWKKAGAISAKQALDELLAYEERFAKRRMLRVAYNCSFDAAFLDHWFRAQGRRLPENYTYFFMDIPSMAWGQGYRLLRGADLAKALGVEDEPHTPLEHTGITGAELNVRIYRALLAREKRG